MTDRRPSARLRRDAGGASPRFERGALVLGDRRVPLLSGALHYWRIAPERWSRALESLRDLGLTMVETYVPWGVHEVADGRFDFGQHDRQKDLPAFLDLAAQLELCVFLRPGPNVNAELPYFGLPRRVVLDGRNQALSASGRPVPLAAPPRMFAAPSYASRHFRAETATWFRAFGEVAAPHCWPNGPVVLLQVDNEAAFYFRDAPYDQDYHPDARADFASFLEDEYGDLAALNRVYGSAHASFADVPMPTRMTATEAAGLAPHLDWMRFHEHSIAQAIAAMADQLCEAGFEGLPLLHNLSMGEGGLPISAARLSRRLDLIGYDFYHSRDGLKQVQKRMRRLSGVSPLPFAPELGVGAPPWFSPRSDDDSLTAALTACAYGLRGFNLYMAVDRDQWYGAPIDADGAPRAAAARWRKLIAALDRIGFHRLERRAQVAISLPREYAHLARATHTLGALSPTLFDLTGISASSACLSDSFGFAEPIQHACSALVARVAEALCHAGVPFVFVESERDLCELPDLALVIAPSYEFADPARFELLHAFAARGGDVLIGPQLPERDHRMQAAHFRAPGARPPFVVRDQVEANALVESLSRELDLKRPFAVTPHSVDAALHEDAEGPRVLFLVQSAPEPVEAEVHLPFPCRLTDALSGEAWSGDSALSIAMAGSSCRMLLCERRAHDSPRPRPPAARAGRTS